MRLRYIDAHVHFWDPVRLNYPWLAEVPAIAGLHTPETLVAEAAEHSPEQIVFVQADCVPEQALAEVAWVESLARAEPRIAAIIAAARVDAGPATLAALDALAAHPHVRGVRHLIQGERMPGFCTRPEFVAGVQALAARRLSFDVCCRSHQLPDVAELVRRCPEISFILDHAGKPPIARGELEPWSRDLAALATLPNIVCKLSGLVTEADHVAWTPAQLAPFMARVLDSFGPQRVLFGGDWPVVKLAAPYRRWLDVAQAAAAALPAADQDAVFRLNARRVYRLD
jgi:L-fuconolactonase